MRLATGLRAAHGVPALIVLAIFLLDLQVPRGTNLALLYLPVLLVWSHWLPRRAILQLTVACSALAMLDIVFSPPDMVLWQVLINRSLTVAALWGMAAAILRTQYFGHVAPPPAPSQAIELDQTREYVAAAESAPPDRSRSKFLSILSGAALPGAPHDRAPEHGSGPDEPLTGPALVADLVRRRKLTPYQAKMIDAGKADDLVFGAYLILEKIGQGGMGRVYKAQHRHLDRTVALKLLCEKTAASPDALRLFRREAKALARLKHPNIVTAHDAGIEKGTRFLAMEYIEGADVAKLVDHYGGLSSQEAVTIGQQAARGLEYAHRQGVIHLDIKPSNLLVDNHGAVFILDLGLARLSSQRGADDSGEQKLSSLWGTINFMAPEQFFCPEQIGPRSDIYSLGCTLYYMFTGKAPYPDRGEAETLESHRDRPLPSLLATRRDLPDELDAVLQRMTAKRPEDRYQSMSAVAADLQKCEPLVAEYALRRDTNRDERASATRDFRDEQTRNIAMPSGVEATKAVESAKVAAPSR